MSNFASPVTPIEASSFTPNNRHAFSPMTSSALATSFPNSSFPSTLSTTPLDPPSWTHNGVSAGSLDWNGGSMPQQNVAWPEIPPPADAGNDDLDPALFETLTKLLEQTQGDPNKQEGDGGEFDLMNAIQQAMAGSPNTNPPPPATAPVPAPMPQQGPGMSQSLLSRRLQQQGSAQTSQAQAKYAMFNLNGPSSSAQPGSLPTSLNGPHGSVPNSTQPFASSLHNRPHPIQTSNWPIPDRAMPWSDTPVSTPGGSELNSPILGGSHNSPYFSHAINGSALSRPPVMPIRREAPQHPSIQQSPHSVNAGSFHSNASSRRPSIDYSQIQQPFPPRLPQVPPQLPQSQPPSLSQSLPQTQLPHRPPTMSTQPQQPPADWLNPANIDMSNLPPLPAGFSLEQMGQMGSSGFEMAIRMGMSLAMMSQNPSPTGQSGATPGSTTTPQHIPSASGSLAASPADQVKQKMQSPQIGQSEFGGPRSIPKSLGASPTLDMPSSLAMSRRPSQGDVGSPLAELMSPEDAAKKDPLATQVWKAYARAREALPNGHRMENLTWRMMHLTLKKQEELAAAAAAKELQEQQVRMAAQIQAALIPQPSASTSTSTSNEGEQRGRRKGKSRVVGFQNQKEDSPGPE